MGKHKSEEYVVWMHKIEKNACDLLEFRGFKKSFRLKRGMSLAGEWADDVEMEMNKAHPDNTVLLDSLFNIKSILVISLRLKKYLESRIPTGVEYLPVNIKDHKDRTIDDEYFVLNLVEHIDCLDEEASQAEGSRMTNKVKSVKGVVLKRLDLAAGRSLFRLKKFGEPTLVTRGFADELDAQGFTGITWGALEDYTDKNW